MRARPLLLVLALVGAAPAPALPRFAARTGAECRQCHVSPSGGGLRTRFGSGVFQRLQLPLRWGDEADEDNGWSFSPRLTEWLTLGADVRSAYLLGVPERAAVAGQPVDVTSSFFLMQADLYTAATLGPHATIVLDVGVYTGFEAWLMLRAASRPSTFDAYVRVGRLMPAFGLRDANHDLYTRQGVGFGPSDRDTGVELTGVAGPLTVAVAVVNGTFGDAVLDTRGSVHRSFEKAISTRASVRLDLGRLQVQLGGSFYFNDNLDQANPLFRRALGTAFEARQGVDELRVGAHLLAGLGPLSYTGEFVFVRDAFVAGPPNHLSGYASAQELGLRVVPGIELMASLEFSDPDVELSGNAVTRFGGAVEVFPTSFLDVRAMVRRAVGGGSPTGDVTDALVFAHAAF